MNEPKCKWEVVIEPVHGYGYTWLLVRDEDPYAEGQNWHETEQEAIDDAQPMIARFGATVRIAKAKTARPAAE